MKKAKTLFFTFICALMLSTMTVSAQSKDKIQFSAKTIENKDVTSAIFSDSKVTMINIWGTFCGPCISEMPDLAKLSKQYEQKDFQIIGIVIDAVNRNGTPSARNVESAKKIAVQTGADYLHIVPNQDMMKSFLSNIYAVPTTFFVDSNGNIIGKAYTGSRSLNDWKKIADGLLK